MQEKIFSLEKAINILEVLSKEPYSYNTTELSKVTGINRTTVHKILATFEEKNFVIKDEKSKEVKIGPALYNLGCIYLRRNSYEDKILQLLNKISKDTGESVGLAIREGSTVVSLYEVEIDRPMKMNYKPGTYYPINRGCYGKCLMAYYDQNIVKELLNSQEFEKICDNTLTQSEEILEEYQKIRKQGFVISDCEVSSYAIGVGVPIFNSSGEARACVAMMFIKEDNYEDKIKQLKETLLKYSKEFTKYIP